MKLPPNPTSEQIAQHVQDALDQREKDNQYNVSPIAYHTHNNTDSPNFPFTNLSDVPKSYKGTAGQVVTVNPNENGLIFGTAAAFPSLPLSITSTTFETAARFNVSTSGSGSAALFDSDGLDLVAFDPGYAVCTWKLNNTGLPNNIFSGQPKLSVELQAGFATGSGPATNQELYIGLGEITTSVVGHSFTQNHTGFKLLGIPGIVQELWATQADGSTETSVRVMLFGSPNPNRGVGFSVYVDMQASAINYWYKIGTGVWTLGATLTTNMPSPSGTNQLCAQYSLVNPSGSTDNPIGATIFGSSFIR